MLETKEIIQSITTLFTEAYAGPPDPSATWFIDNEPDSGVLGLISRVSAKEASWSSREDDPGTTIASHVEHLRWSLANASEAIEGKPYQGNWKESWNMLHADEEKWNQLRQALRVEYERLLKNLQNQADLPPGDFLTGVVALLPHAAYHLGTIRQLIERAQSGMEVSAIK
jgi:hypothetical protein